MLFGRHLETQILINHKGYFLLLKCGLKRIPTVKELSQEFCQLYISIILYQLWMVNKVYFQNYTLETSFIDHWTFYIVQDTFRRKLVELNNGNHLKIFPPKPQKISATAARLLGCFSMSAPFGSIWLWLALFDPIWLCLPCLSLFDLDWPFLTQFDFVWPCLSWFYPI